MPIELDPRYFLSIFWRRFPAFLLTSVLIFAGFAAAAVLLPATYTSRAKILVESQQIPTNLVQSTVGSHAAERLRVIQQRLMTRENMLEIASEYDVFADRRNLSPTEIVTEMRRTTNFRQISLGGGGRGGAMSLSFNISFSASDPRIAARVASEYVTRILEDNLRLRTGRAADTYEFFEQESERLGGELTAIEVEIVDFKRANRDTLPETLGFRTNQLERVQQRQQLLDREKADLEQRRKLLVEMQERPEQLVDAQRPMTEAEKAKSALENRRRVRLAILSPEHPEIRGYDTRIGALDRIIASEAEERESANSQRVAQVVSDELQRISSDIELIDKSLDQIEDELVSLERRESELERSIAETPNTQMALTALQRNYSNLQEQYGTVRNKLAVSATGEQLELKQQAERFEVIEQATTPETPDKPDRLMILVMGFGGGAGAGLGLVVLLEIVNRSIRRPSDVFAAVDAQPLAVIPYIFTDEELRRRQRIKWTLLVLVFGGGTAMVILTHIFYLPLDLIAQRMIEQTELDTVLELVRSRLNM